MSNRVFVLDRNKRPLMPCHPARARELLSGGRAAVFRRFPFTIILKDREGGEVQPVAFKVDPGSKVSGVAIVADRAKGKAVVFAAEIEHRGKQVKAALGIRKTVRRSRRQRKTRYREMRFDNRRRSEGWHPPSLRSRIDNVVTWFERFRRFIPVSSISMELARFDTQAMRDPEIDGVQYQRGTLMGYEVKEYLLEKFDRKCVYCRKGGIPLQVEHVIPKSRWGTDCVDNLAISCDKCNKLKGSKTASEFGFPEIELLAKSSLKDAVIMNSVRWYLWKNLSSRGLPTEVGTGGRTKYNRISQGYEKAHWIDASCIGKSGNPVLVNPGIVPLKIKATGRGKRCICLTNKFGFPIKYRQRQRRWFGYRTGDMVRAMLVTGKNIGLHIGRVIVRSKPWFSLNNISVHIRTLSILQKSDGYNYF